SAILIYPRMARSARTLPDAGCRNKRSTSTTDMGIVAARRQSAPFMAGLIVLALAASRAMPGESPATPPAVGHALQAWAAAHGVRRAFVVVRRDGRIVHRSALGGADPDAPVHLASLSKAITAACVATLVRDGKLAFATPVATALAPFIAAHGRPR